MMGSSINGSSFIFFFLICIAFLNSSFLPCTGKVFDLHPMIAMMSQEELAQAAGYGEEKLSSVLVTGTLLCNSYTHGRHHGAHAAHISAIADASVGVTCKNIGRKRRNICWARGKTDEYGDFIIDLPSHLHAVPKLHESCKIRVLRLPKDSPCHRTLHGRSRPIELSSVGNGIRTYTTGTIRLK